MLNTENFNEETAEKTVSLGMRIAKELIEWVLVIVIAVGAAFLIRNYLFTMVKVDGRSMDYTLADGDRLCVIRLNYTPKNGDIVVFNPYGNKSRPYIKRVIATEGQSIYIDDAGSVFVDGQKLTEDYIGSPTNHGIAFPVDKNGEPTNDMSRVAEIVSATAEKPYIVPECHIFAMGDNRSASHDCRDIGPVKVEDVVGRAVFRVFPFGTFGGLD